MYNPVKKSIEKDMRLNKSSSLLWNLNNGEPEIRQIYGHFLPPNHMEVVKRIRLVAKDFNFPAAYHAHASKEKLKKLFIKGKEISADTLISMNNSIRIRKDGNGAIVYTPYHNGFYLNKLAYSIISSCNEKISVKNLADKLGVAFENVLEFLTKAFTLEIIDVCP